MRLTQFEDLIGTSNAKCSVIHQYVLSCIHSFHRIWSPCVGIHLKSLTNFPKMAQYHLLLDIIATVRQRLSGRGEFKSASQNSRLLDCGHHFRNHWPCSPGLLSATTCPQSQQRTQPRIATQITRGALSASCLGFGLDFPGTVQAQ